MTIAIEQLTKQRAALTRAFEELALKNSINIEFNRDSRMLNLCERLYEEKLGSRKIIIDFNYDSVFILDPIVSRRGNFSNIYTLLELHVNNRGLDFANLWEIRCAWLNKGLTPAKVE